MLTIQRVNPLDYSDALKSLFAANEMQALVPRFDATSTELVRTGGASWVGLDDSGGVQLHVTLVRQDFAFRGRTIRAGTLGNLVASKTYRCLFPAASLLNQLVRDISRDAILDFLYSDPPPASAAVARTAGLRQFATLDRFVIPLSDPRPAQALAARAYATALRLGFGVVAANCTMIDSAEYHVEQLGGTRENSGRLLPCHSDAMYRRRLPRYPGPEYAWCEFYLRGRRGSRTHDAVGLLYGPDELKIAHVWAIRRAPGIALSPLIPGLLRAARQRGAHRLQIETVRESNFARELQRAGFRKRGDLIPIFGKAITPAGDEVVNAVHDWEITAIDMER